MSEPESEGVRNFWRAFMLVAAALFAVAVFVAVACVPPHARNPLAYPCCCTCLPPPGVPSDAGPEACR